jgi:hypothetical protein
VGSPFVFHRGDAQKAAPFGHPSCQTLGVMKPALLYVLRFALAVLAASAWALVYPRNDRAANYIFLTSLAAWLTLSFATRGTTQARVLYVAVASVAAAFIAHTWLGIHWRYGLWAPDMPLLLLELLDTNAETAWKVRAAGLFVVVLAFLAAIGLTSRRLRVVLNISPSRAQNDA